MRPSEEVLTCDKDAIEVKASSNDRSERRIIRKDLFGLLVSVSLQLVSQDSSDLETCP